MTTLTLWFYDNELTETRFCHPLLTSPRLLTRGKEGGALPNCGSFQWTRAVHALCLLLVRTAYANVTHSEAPAALRGGKNSAALALDYAIGKEPQWLLDMFGADSHGRCLARRLFRRSNPEAKRPGPVTLTIRQTTLSAPSLSIISDGTLLTDSLKLKYLSEMLDLCWEKRAAAQAAALNASEASTSLRSLAA